MNKSLLVLSGLILCAGMSAFGQRTATVFDIQNVPGTRLANCDDRPTLTDSLVRVRGIVITPGNARGVNPNSPSANRQVWIQDLSSNGAFHNIDVFGADLTTPDDLRNLVAGDTIEVVGKVLEFNGTSTTNPTNDGETEIAPEPDGVTLVGPYNAGQPVPTSTLLANVGVLNDATRLNNLETGEQWEGAFVELQNLTVVAVAPFTSGGEQRVSFTVADAQGNRIEVSDRFAAGRLSAGFVAPNVGDNFTSIKGIIIHSKNRCAQTGANNRGYTLNPFATSHYQRGAQAPTISAITRDLVSPCSTNAVTVSANITDDGSIASATLKYMIGTSTTPINVTMTASGSVYSGQIPAQPEGTLVKYYISSTDNAGNTTNNPNVPNNSTPFFYTVRCGAPLIKDIQYTPFQDGLSGYRNLTVTNVEGVITADASTENLGQVYMQTPGETSWAGIWLVGGPTISSLRVGDLVRVTGTVEEDFNVTRISVTSANRISSGNTLAPITVDPSVVTTYSFAQNEAYEGMLLKVQAASGNLYVVDTNTANGTSNFGEWRLGADQFDPNSGVVIHTGYRNNTNYSSLSVSYINNLGRWASALNPGVTPVLIGQGDQFSSATGILYYGFSLLKLLPRTNDDLAGFVSEVKKDVAAGRFVSLYPNPANGTATLKIATAGLNGSLKGATYKVTTVVGGTVKLQGAISDAETKLNIATLTPGVYNLVITGSNGIVTEKLVVE